MKFESGKLYHVYNQGNDRRPIFFSKRNFRFFMKKMEKHLTPHCHILAWCLMPNHFHWMLLVKTRQTARSGQTGDASDQMGIEGTGQTASSGQTGNRKLTRVIGTVLSSYTQAINKQQNRSGSLFRQKTKAIEIESLEYALTCFHYIHQNPVKAGFAENPEEWKFSSFREYLGDGNNHLTDTSKALEWLGMNRKAFLRATYHAITADLSVK